MLRLCFFYAPTHSDHLTHLFASPKTKKNSLTIYSSYYFFVWKKTTCSWRLPFPLPKNRHWYHILPVYTYCTLLVSCTRMMFVYTLMTFSTPNNFSMLPRAWKSFFSSYQNHQQRMMGKAKDTTKKRQQHNITHFISPLLLVHLSVYTIFP